MGESMLRIEVDGNFYDWTVSTLQADTLVNFVWAAFGDPDTYG